MSVVTTKKQFYNKEFVRGLNLNITIRPTSYETNLSCHLMKEREPVLDIL